MAIVLELAYKIRPKYMCAPESAAQIFIKLKSQIATSEHLRKHKQSLVLINL